MPIAVPSSSDTLIRSRTWPWHLLRHEIHIKKTRNNEEEEEEEGRFYSWCFQAAKRTKKGSTWRGAGLDGVAVGSANVVLLLSLATFDAQFSAVGAGRGIEERREKELLSLSPFVYGLCPPQ